MKIVFEPLGILSNVKNPSLQPSIFGTFFLHPDVTKIFHRG